MLRDLKSLRPWPESPEKLGLVILLLGLITRFWYLSYPAQVIFDEVHFGKFVTAYAVTGERFFDMHPPHAKLLIAGAAKLAGYHSAFSFDRISQPYLEVSCWALRWLPAFAGALLPLVFYWLLIEMGASLACGFLGAFCILFDNANTAHSRILSLDPILLCALFGSLAAFLRAEKEGGRRRVGFLLLAGGLSGLASGTKFTGLIAPMVVGLAVLMKALPQRSLAAFSHWVKPLSIYLAGGLTVYLLGWWLHFALLSNPGTGDAFFLPEGKFWRDMILMHKLMFEYHAGIHVAHPYASAWWTWPISKIAVLLWTEKQRVLYLIGNPVLWWGTLFLFVGILAGRVFSWAGGAPAVPRVSKKIPLIWLPVIAYFLAYLPFIPIRRPMFLYHYFTPLLFSIMAVLLWMDQIGWTRPGSLKGQRVSYYFVALALFLGFVAFLPVTYGLGGPEAYLRGLCRVIHSWR